MISASEARKQVNQEMTEACEKQMKKVEEALTHAIKNKNTSFTVSEVLLPPVKAKLISQPLCYDVKEIEDNERGMTYTITQISF